MATINGSTNNSQWTYKLEASETATSISNNTSTVQVQVYLGRASSTSYLGGNYNVSVTCDGSTQSTSGTISYPTYINGGAWLLLKTFTFTVKHNSDGKKTANISSSFSSSDFTPSSASASGSITLSQLHKYPLPDIGTISELNQKLIDAGIGEHYFVSNLSKKSFPISGTVYDGATISKYLLHNGNTNIESNTTPVIIDFASTPLYYEYSEQYSRNVAPFSIGVRDNFGLQAYFMYNNNYVIPYVKPNLIPTSSNVKRNGQLTGKVKLNLTGTFYNNKVGTVSNGITLNFKYWKVGTTEPSTYYTIPTSAYTISGNNVTISNWIITKNGTVISDVDKSSAYKFKIKAIDSFDSVSEIELTCSKGEWLMAKFKDRIDFKKITIGGYDPFEYSTEEQVIGTWIDKPLYRKVVTGITNADDTSLLLISNADKIVNHSINIKRNGIEQIHPTSGLMVGEEHASPLFLNSETSEIRLYITNQVYQSQEFYGWVEYTKTTD